MNLIYIVSGFMRSFTSMMMRCLEAGGMDACYDKEKDDWRKQFVKDGYDPNQGGMYEMTPEHRLQFYVNPSKFNGKLLKILANYGFLNLPMWDGRYKVLFLLRHPAEIKDSYKRFFGEDIVYKGKDDSFNQPFTETLYYQLMDKAIGQAKNRRDIDIDIVHGKSVLQNPLASFFDIRNRDWPIEPWHAASIVDPSLYRQRKTA